MSQTIVVKQLFHTNTTVCVCALSPWQTCPVCRLSTGPLPQAQPTLASPSVTRVTATAPTSCPQTTPSWTWVGARSLPLPQPPSLASTSSWMAATNPSHPASTRCLPTGQPSKKRRRATQRLRHWRPCPPPPCTLNSLLPPLPPPRPCHRSLALRSYGRSTLCPNSIPTVWAPAWKQAP